MKKVLTLSLLICACILKAQTAVYVIFTSTDSEVEGVWHFTFDKTVNDRDIPHLFTLFNRANENKEQGYFYRFIYENSKEMPNNPFFYEHQSILDTKMVIDWDLVTSKQEVQEKYDYILSCDKIYFIDRKESSGSTIKIYPTKLFKLNFQ